MTASKHQHMISSAIIMLLALLVTWISFTEQPAEAFLFPRLIAIFFVGLAVWNFIRAVMGLAKVGEGLALSSFINITYGLAVVLVYVFFAAKFLGFFTASTIAFLMLFTLYDPSPLTDLKAWAKRVSITLIFMAVIYGLFAWLLKVQTPKGLFF